jgi:hypothetical protein
MDLARNVLVLLPLTGFLAFYKQWKTPLRINLHISIFITNTDNDLQ